MGIARLLPAELPLLSDSHSLGFRVLINCLLGDQVNFISCYSAQGIN